MSEQSHQSEAGAIAEELFEIIHNERAEHIFTNEWLHDSTLRIPSVNAILLMAEILLGDDNLTIGKADPLPQERTNLFEFAGIHPMTETLPAIVFQLRKHSQDTLTAIAQRYWGGVAGEKLRHGGEKLRYDGSRRAEWGRLYDRFHLMAFGKTSAKDNGARGLARRLMESLFLRAMLFRDSDSFRALADVIDLDGPQSWDRHRIASEAVGWESRLSRELMRNVSKGEMKAFLREFFPRLTDGKNEWTAAWKLAKWPTNLDKKGTRHYDEVIAIAKRIKNEP